jgi:hypothetical protein
VITCRDCGKKRLVWVTTDNGEDVLYELGAPHFVHCPATRKNGAKAPRQPRKSGDSPATEAHELAVAGLMALRYKVTEARDMLKDIPEGEPAEMVKRALQKMGADAPS